MRSHGLVSDVGTVTPGGCVMRSWCCCGFSFAVSARTVKRAKRAVGRKFRDHRGQAYAAGPGWRQT